MCEIGLIGRYEGKEGMPGRLMLEEYGRSKLIGQQGRRRLEGYVRPCLGQESRGRSSEEYEEYEEYDWPRSKQEGSRRYSKEYREYKEYDLPRSRQESRKSSQEYDVYEDV